MLSFLQDEMKLPFVQPDGRPVVSSNRLAAEEAGQADRAWSALRSGRLKGNYRTLHAARSETQTFQDLRQVAQGLAEQLAQRGGLKPQANRSGDS